MFTHRQLKFIFKTEPTTERVHREGRHGAFTIEEDWDRPGLGRPQAVSSYEAKRSVGWRSRASPLSPWHCTEHRLLQVGQCPQEGPQSCVSILQPESTSCLLCSPLLPQAAEAEPHGHFLSLVCVLKKLCRRGGCPVNHHF